jgi:hypothetical protein
MSRPRVTLSEADFDFEEAEITSVKFDKHEVIMKLCGVAVPGSRTKTVILRFEVVDGFETLFTFLTIRIERSQLKVPGFTKPILHERQKPAPLVLPAKLKRLEEQEGPRGKRTFAFALDEPRFQDRKKPVLITCKHLVITNGSGKPIAGDSPRDPSSVKKWRPKDFREFARRFADAVEEGNYALVHELCDDPLRKQRSRRQIATEFEGWKSRTPIPEEARQSFRRLYEIELDDPSDLLDLIPPDLDPEACRARVMIGFLGRFGVFLILVDRDGALRIGSCAIERDWD